MNAPRIRCRCRNCGRTQVIKIKEYLMGAKCILGKSIKAPTYNCAGTLEYYSDDHEDAFLNASHLLQYLRETHFDDPKLGELVDTVADDLWHWLSRNETPQEMGWVGQNGLP